MSGQGMPRVVTDERGPCDAEHPSQYIFERDGELVTMCRCIVCARCGHHARNAHQGHYWSFCSKTGELEGFHFCCPDLPCEYPAAVPEERPYQHHYSATEGHHPDCQGDFAHDGPCKV